MPVVNEQQARLMRSAQQEWNAIRNAERKLFIRNQVQIQAAGLQSEYNGWEDYYRHAGFDDESDPDDSEDKEENHASKRWCTDADWPCQSAGNAQFPSFPLLSTREQVHQLYMNANNGNAAAQWLYLCVLAQAHEWERLRRPLGEAHSRVLEVERTAIIVPAWQRQQSAELRRGIGPPSHREGGPSSGAVEEVDEQRVRQWTNADPDHFVVQWMLRYPQSARAQLPVVRVENGNISMIDLWANRLIYHLRPEGIGPDGAYESVRRQLFLRALSEVLA